MKINLKYNYVKSVPYLVSLTIFLAVAVFSYFYIYLSFEDTKGGYFDLNPCFYQANQWFQSFNPATKLSGDLYCTVAIITSIIGFIYVSWRLITLRRVKQKTFALEIRPGAFIFPVFLCILQLCLWFWGQTMVAPSFDEVFSAVNCASVPVFQCMSYYMLPNNHVFFNLLNNILFHTASDHVFTGRIISLFAYLVLVIWAYFWFARQFKNRILAFLSAIVLAVQFSTWGFGFQARGYEIYALAQWAAFTLLFDYITSGRKRYLVLNAVFCVIGYITIPSFLYYHAAQILLMALYQVVHKKFDFRFWKYQVLSIVFVFYFYLPVICFSGIEALVGNKYILPSHASTYQFLQEVEFYSRSYIEYCFSNNFLSPTWLSLILFVLPVLLLFTKKKWLGVFVIVQVISFIAIVFLMKKLPFHRNLAGQYVIILTVTIFTIYHVLDNIKSWYSKPVFAIMMILLIGHFIRIGSRGMANNLYFDDATNAYSSIGQYLDDLPKGAVVGCSDQCFYWYYLCSQKHITAHQCPDGQETYYIKQLDEGFPSALHPLSYKLQSKILDYEVFRMIAK